MEESKLIDEIHCAIKWFFFFFCSFFFFAVPFISVKRRRSDGRRRMCGMMYEKERMFE